MKKRILLFFKGFLIGVANIIPGVSGGTMAVSLGIYERLIEIVADFKKNIKENILFVLPIVIGVGSAILFLTNIISFALEEYELITVLFFAGLIMGGIPVITKKIEGKKSIKNIIPFLLVVIFMFALTLLKTDTIVEFTNMATGDYLILLGVGAIAAITMVVPGISGSFVLMLMGYYKPILDLIKDLINFKNIWANLLIVVLLAIGVVFGVIISSKLIKKSLQKYKSQTYSAILGFVIASVLSMIFSLNINIGFIEIIIGILVMIFGCVLTYKLEK